MNAGKADVFIKDQWVGTLAETPDHRIAFSYADQWLESGFAISPFSLPPEKKVFLPSSSVFQGLWGVFADSLPDSWGRLLVDRMLRFHGISPDSISALDRLLIVGDAGMGALAYRPAWDLPADAVMPDIDLLSEQCRAVLQHENTENIDDLFRLGGSSGGARPKAATEDWIIKFPSSRDMTDVGIMEKEYMDCAAECGIIVPECKLIPSRYCGGFFAVRRFDRDHGIRHHMLTAAAILEADWRNAFADYNTLMKLTAVLSRGSRDDLLQMYRRMCFNVFAHNRDDHLKNFSWIYDAQNDCWHPSPAYDLTWSTTYYGEHTTTVDGNGRNPGEKELISVGRNAHLPDRLCKQIAEEIRAKTAPLEKKYRDMLS